MTLSRRNFIKLIGTSAIATGTLGASIIETQKPHVKEARYYRALDNNLVECLLCPNRCILRKNSTGSCGVRVNHDGKLYTLVYGKLCSINNDPVEKKPLYHFLPGSNAISVATPGCNLHCKFCQNHTISQAKPNQITTRYVSPKRLIATAQKYNSPMVAYTYSEPTIFYEYMYDTASINSDVKNVMISAGYIEEEPLKNLCQVLDGIKIDLKSFSNDFYRNLVSGQLEPVLRSLRIINESNTWLEIVYLVIPTQNDNMEDIKKMSEWIVKNLGPDVPIHFTRFHPSYLMKNLPPTPIDTLDNAYSTARKAGINYVYIGNLPSHRGSDTICPGCGKNLISRRGFLISEKSLNNGKCPDCNRKIPGVWT